MKTEQIKLTQVKTNKLNPRTITSDKFNKLINSILAFPKMLEIRPIVIDNKMMALGGNMRNNALKEIAEMSVEQLALRIYSLADYQKKTEGEKKVLADWWSKWLEAPFAYIIRASELSAEEQKQFIIKDNVSFGTWDYDMLANSFDNSSLEDWGMDVWNANPISFDSGSTEQRNTSSAPDSSEEDEDALSNKSAISMGKHDDMTELRIRFTTDTYARVMNALCLFDENEDIALLKALGLYEQ